MSINARTMPVYARILFGCLVGVLLLAVGLPAAHAQDTASAIWPLTEQQPSAITVTGAAAGSDVSGHGSLVVRDYASYSGPLGVNMQRWWLGGSDWPVESAYNPGRYVQFVVGPVGDASLTIERIRLAVGSMGTSNFRAAILYSKDPSFSDAVLLHDGIAARDSYTAHDFNVNVGVNDGGTFYLRVFPYTNAGGSGRSLTIQNVRIDGVTVPIELPDVQTGDVTEITVVSAVAGGIVLDEGGAAVQARGVVWSTSPQPTLDDSYTTDGTGTGEFTSLLTGLSGGTTYYVRAYATNRIGTTYGDQEHFTTVAEGHEQVPSVETGAVSRVRSTSVRIAGAVTDHGGAEITQRGIVWSFSPGATTADNKVIETGGVGGFVSHIQGLERSTTYYARAFATNSVGTAYGGDVTFTTAAEDASFAIAGYATMNGGTTGGEGQPTVHEYVLSEYWPTSGYESPGEAIYQLLRLHKDKPNEGLIIYVDMTVHENEFGRSKMDVKDLFNVSIIGVGTSGRFTGVGFTISRAHNVIIRNLTIHHVRQGSGTAIEVTESSSNIWIDHNEFYSELENAPNSDYYDGLVDIKRNAEYVTVSWNYFHDHWKTMLLGHTDNESLKPDHITYMNNRFRNLNSRTPLIRYAKVHMLNNLFQDVHDTAINARMGAQVLVEGNYFENVGEGNPDPATGFIKGPVGWFYGSSQTGYWNLRGNEFVNTPHEHLSSTTGFEVSYAYDPYDADEARELVLLYAGVGKLGSQEFPTRSDPVVPEVGAPVVMHAFPNPSTGLITVGFALQADAPTNLRVYNLVGQRVLDVLDDTFSAGRHEKLVDLTGLASGVYILALHTGGQRIHQRIVLTR